PDRGDVEAREEEGRQRDADEEDDAAHRGDVLLEDPALVDGHVAGQRGAGDLLAPEPRDDPRAHVERDEEREDRGERGAERDVLDEAEAGDRLLEAAEEVVEQGPFPAGRAPTRWAGARSPSRLGPASGRGARRCAP